MTFPITPEERRALLEVFHVEEHSAYHADLADRVEAEAAAATRLPSWWPFAVTAVLVLTIALSAALPWGWAS